jgi:hypothetical protein
MTRAVPVGPRQIRLPSRMAFSFRLVLRARPADVERMRLLAVGPEGDRLLVAGSRKRVLPAFTS